MRLLRVSDKTTMAIVIATVLMVDAFTLWMFLAK